MSTEFYNRSDHEIIGKRFAIGLFCWNCKRSLAKASDLIAFIRDWKNRKWYNRCPECGKKPDFESFCDSAISRELGWKDKIYQKKKGVKTASAFIWYINPKEVKEVFIIDSNNKIYSREFFFNKILLECPIQFNAKYERINGKNKIV